MITWYRLLDSVHHLWNLGWKTVAGRQRWGVSWRDKTRSGRRYTRVQFSPIGFDLGQIDIAIAQRPGIWSHRPNLHAEYRIRPEPGWEWTCPNCKTYSMITASMMPAILRDWEEMAVKTVARGYKPPARPTAATAGCTNCRFLPGAPE
jgi:hypothetical protein